MSHLEITRAGVIAPVRVDPAGLRGPTYALARGRHWHRVGPGFYRPAAVDLTTAQRIADAVGCMPPGAAATGWAALSWLDGRWFGGYGPDGITPLDVPVAVGDQHTARQRAGVVLSEDWLYDDDIVVIDGLPITVPERSVSYAARTATSLVAAIQVIEMAAYDDFVSLAELATYAARIAGRPGTVQLRNALAMASENSWSPQETRMRFHWEQRVPDRQLLCNTPIFDLNGAHLFTPDLFDPVAAVAGEYNGAQHEKSNNYSRDLDREELTKCLAIEVVTTKAGVGERSRFLTRLAGAYARAARHRGPRTWTLAQPERWVDTSTVAQRRALSSYDREIWLRHRRRT